MVVHFGFELKENMLAANVFLLDGSTPPASLDEGARAAHVHSVDWLFPPTAVWGSNLFIFKQLIPDCFGQVPAA